MIRRDDFAHLSDFDLALRTVEVAAEYALAEACELRSHGFTVVQVVGLQVIWAVKEDF